MSLDLIESVFGDAGHLAASFQNYEKRVGQIDLSRKIDEGMRTGRHVLGEGPCGTGKGVAYCVPAIHHALATGGKAVIATANIALQEQLVTKDLPTLQRVLPEKFTFCLLKGKNNFLCPWRMSTLGSREALKDPLLHKQEKDVLQWSFATQTGDRSELSFEPDPSVWARMSVTSDDCLGAESCKFRRECHWKRFREAAEKANVIVTNYHLLFAHLHVRALTAQNIVLPGFKYLVLDEAHEAPHIARDFFGFTLTEGGVRRTAVELGEVGALETGRIIEEKVAPFFKAVYTYAKSSAYKIRLRRPWFVPEPRELLDAMYSGLDAANAWVKDHAAKEDKAIGYRIARKLESYAQNISDTCRLENANFVYYIELDRGRTKLCGKPISVADILRRTLFNCGAQVSLVSATMTTGGTFDFVKKQTGITPEMRTLEVVGVTPFDFRKQALLVLPKGLPDPREDTFAPCVTPVFDAVIKACNGRTLGLFTSYKNMQTVRDGMSTKGYRVLMQGELPRTELTRIFKQDKHSVLLGTASFWTGIDVQGDALTGLLIDKMPFPNPSDPVVDAISANNPDWFMTYSLPTAIIALRQGFGRLIRTQSDYGVVVITDPRLMLKPYGKLVLSSLPRCNISDDVNDIPQFLASVQGTV
jgi:ATP-dependent DNA helicase DinG